MSQSDVGLKSDSEVEGMYGAPDELDSSTSINALPSHGGYTSGMPMYPDDKKEAYSNMLTAKRRSNPKLDDDGGESSTHGPSFTMRDVREPFTQPQ